MDGQTWRVTSGTTFRLHAASVRDWLREDRGPRPSGLVVAVLAFSLSQIVSSQGDLESFLHSVLAGGKADRVLVISHDHVTGGTGGGVCGQRRSRGAATAGRCARRYLPAGARHRLHSATGARRALSPPAPSGLHLYRTVCPAADPHRARPPPMHTETCGGRPSTGSRMADGITETAFSMELLERAAATCGYSVARHAFAFAPHAHWLLASLSAAVVRPT